MNNHHAPAKSTRTDMLVCGPPPGVRVITQANCHASMLSTTILSFGPADMQYLAEDRYLHPPFVSASAKKPLSGSLARFGCCCGFSASPDAAAQEQGRPLCEILPLEPGRAASEDRMRLCSTDSMAQRRMIALPIASTPKANANVTEKGTLAGSAQTAANSVMSFV